jgi:hypothetical protein
MVSAKLCDESVESYVSGLAQLAGHWRHLRNFQKSGSPKQTRIFIQLHIKKKKKKTPWSESASELYRPSDRLLSAK